MPKIKLPENIQKLKEQLETGNNLVDYFFICGIDPSLCLNESLYEVSTKENLENLKNILKPTILSRFPEFNKQNYEVGDEILEYCFPNGFELINNNSYIPYRKIFTIILDNNNSSQDYPQKYLTCILFYEQLYQYKKLQQQIEKIEKNKEKNIKNENNENINNMRSKLEDEKNKNIYRHKKISSSGVLSFNFQLNKKLKEKLNEKEREKEKENEINNKQPLNKLKYYYVPKCICLLSIHPRIKLFQKILLHIYEYGLQQNVDIPLEKIITNLIIEVPLPPRGLYSINYNYYYEYYQKKENNNQDLITKSVALNVNITQESLMKKEENLAPPLISTENNKLLITEIDLRKFNNILSFNCKMEVIKHILLSSKIIFFSQNLTNLTDIISSFLVLIFPFKYPFNVTSLLKKEFYYMLGSPTPFIFGINEEYDKNFFEENEISLEQTNFLVIDLDSKNENNYYLFSDEEFPQLPLKLVSNLEKEIKSLENMDKNNYNNNINNKNIINDREKIIKEYNEKYQEKFFNFFCEILKGYEEFLNRDFFGDDYVSITTLFNCEKFIKSSYHSQSDYAFYFKFVDISQLFMDFIYKNMIPKNNSQLMDILIVNNYYQKKKKTKSNEVDPYLINNKYVVPFPKELTKEECEEIISKKLSLSKKGQIVNQAKEELINFEYFLFPSLDFDIYCNNDNVNQYISPPDYREEIEALNMESISKSSLGQNINREMEMKNYIYLTWLEIWAFTFGNNDLGERHYRFDQMLDVLDKVIHHEMNILNLMFDILNKYNEHQMMLKLYQKLLRLRLNPSTTIFDTMSKILDKDKLKDLLEETKKNTTNIQKLKFNDYNKNNFRERTFLSINDDLPLETKPKFYFDYFCILCSEKINLYSICKNFEGIKNDTLWVKCSKCGEYNLPKIKVKFGLDFINDKSKSTSIKEYVLHSPYNLKINIKQAVNTQFRSLNKEEKIKLKISNFKAEFQPLFWDFIWYCLIHNLDYNILLPYSKNLEEEKKAHCFNPNIKIFEVIYDDSTFKDNQNKIEKISNSIIKLNSGEKNKKKIFNNLKKCGIIMVEIINKKINIINKKDEINNKIEENNKNKNNENIDKKNDEINNKENSGNKPPIVKKKVSMFDFFYNVSKKIEEVKSEIQKEKLKKEE